MIGWLHNFLVRLANRYPVLYPLIHGAALLAFPILFVLGDAGKNPFLFTGILLIGCGIGTGAVSKIFTSRSENGPLNQEGINNIWSKCKTWPMLLSVIGQCGFVLFAWGLLFVNVSTAIILYEARKLLLSFSLAFSFTSKHEGRRTLQRFFRVIFYIQATAGVVLVILSQSDTPLPLLAIGTVFANPGTLLGGTFVGVVFVLTAAFFWVLQRTCTTKMAQELANEHRDHKIDEYKKIYKMDNKIVSEVDNEINYEIGDFERIMSSISSVIAGAMLCAFGLFVLEPIISLHQLFYVIMGTLIYSIGTVAIESQRLSLLVVEDFKKMNEERRIEKNKAQVEVWKGLALKEERANQSKTVSEMKRFIGYAHQIENSFLKNMPEISLIDEQVKKLANIYFERASKAKRFKVHVNRLINAYFTDTREKKHFKGESLAVKAVLATRVFQFATPLGILSVLYVLGILDVSHLDYLIIGTIGITVSNLMTEDNSNEISSKTRFTNQALMVSLWVFGTFTYFTTGFATQVSLELPVTIFILVLVFRVTRLVERTNQEEKWVLEVFRKLEFLSFKKDNTDVLESNFLKNATNCLLRIDAYKSKDELTTEYKEMVLQLNLVTPSDEIAEIRQLVDSLAHSRQQGSRIDETVAISIVAFLLVIGLLVFNGSSKLSGEFYNELTSFLLSSIVVFLLFNILELENDRKDETLRKHIYYSGERDISSFTRAPKPDMAPYDSVDYIVNFEGHKNSEIDMTSVAISLVIIVLFCLLFTGVFKPL